jgi:parvulin-like peptidyl-prolyl isomerase
MAAAKSMGLEASETPTTVSRGSALPAIGASQRVDSVAFGLPVGGVSEPIAAGDATVIVKVVERDEATPEELRRDREVFRAQLLNERRDRFFAAYMGRVRDQMRIEVNNEVLRRALQAMGI